jgi:hypothetical protein
VSLRALRPTALIGRLELILRRHLREVQVIVDHLNPVLLFPYIGFDILKPCRILRSEIKRCQASHEDR